MKKVKIEKGRSSTSNDASLIFLTEDKDYTMEKTHLYYQPKKSLTYWELVRKKFFRKPYAVIGTFIVLSIIVKFDKPKKSIFNNPRSANANISYCVNGGASSSLIGGL